MRSKTGGLLIGTFAESHYYIQKLNFNFSSNFYSHQLLQFLSPDPNIGVTCKGANKKPPTFCVHLSCEKFPYFSQFCSSHKIKEIKKHQQVNTITTSGRHAFPFVTDAYR